MSPLSTTDRILTSITLSSLIPCVDEITGYSHVDFDVFDQLLVRYAFIKYWGRSGSAVGSVFELLDFNKVYDPVRRNVLYNSVVQFGIPMKLVRRVKCI